MTLASLWSGRPQITELVVDSPVLHVPLLRERSGQLISSARPAASPGGARQGRDRSHHRDRRRGGAFQSARPRGKSHRGHQRRSQHRRRSQDQAHRQRAAPAISRSNSTDQRDGAGRRRWSGRTFRSSSRSMRPACCRRRCRPRPRSGSTAPIVMINGLSGTLGDGAFNGWASVDLASKPLVKLDLDFQRLDVGGAKASAHARARSPGAMRPSTSTD